MCKEPFCHSYHHRFNVSAQNWKQRFRSEEAPTLASANHGGWLPPHFLFFLLWLDLLRLEGFVLNISAVALVRGAVKQASYNGLWGGYSSAVGGHSPIIGGHGRRVVKVSNDLTVRGRSAFNPGRCCFLCFQNTHTGVDTGRRRLQTVVCTVTVRYKLWVKHCPVRGRSHWLSVQLHLLLWVPELQGTGPSVWRGLLSVRQSDGGGQLDQTLGQVGIRGLEATGPVGGLEPLGLQVRGGASVCGTRAVHLRLIQSSISPLWGP